MCWFGHQSTSKGLIGAWRNILMTRPREEKRQARKPCQGLAKTLDRDIVDFLVALRMSGLVIVGSFLSRTRLVWVFCALFSMACIMRPSCECHKKIHKEFECWQATMHPRSSKGCDQRGCHTGKVWRRKYRVFKKIMDRETNYTHVYMERNPYVWSMCGSVV